LALKGRGFSRAVHSLAEVGALAPDDTQARMLVPTMS
jgi:hypothetical protein